MILVAIAMVAIIAMAALSIDVVTLYLAKQEAQRSADAAALAAARVISMSGITGTATTDTDPPYWQAICGGNTGIATKAATAVGAQNSVGNGAATVTVTYSAGNGGTISSNTDCSALPDAFGVNPMVTVQIQQTGLPTFFSRIWRRTTNTVSATASAEVFNPSNSGNLGNQTSGTITPVQPRCVKPWIVPNLDPLNPSGCTNATPCQPFVSNSDGHIVNPGISLNGLSNGGVIGERFQLIPDCLHHISGLCSLRDTPIRPNHPTNGNTVPAPPNLEFLPGQTENAAVAIPSAASGGTLYEKAIAGCDQTTVYYCGISESSPIGSGPNMVDLAIYPADDTSNGVQALINETNPNPNGGQPTGQDYFNPTASPYGYPTAYPFQILAGSSNPTGLTSGTPVTASNSIVSVPIYDPTNPIANTGTSPVTIVGFLQVFINAVDQYGNLDVVVLNVAGCSDGTGQPVGTAVAGSSPVPVRLITPP
jgi:Flp pilus assembly protein TadG